MVNIFREEHGFDFAIRTPCTPARWEDYDAEMAMAWDVRYSYNYTKPLRLYFFSQYIYDPMGLFMWLASNTGMQKIQIFKSKLLYVHLNISISNPKYIFLD